MPRDFGEDMDEDVPFDAEFHEYCPRWLLDLAIKMDELLVDPAALEITQNMVWKWRQEHESRVGAGRGVEILPPRRLSLAHEFAIMSAIHDQVCAGAKQIDWWDRKRKRTPLCRDKSEVHAKVACSGFPYQLMRDAVESIADNDRWRVEQASRHVRAHLRKELKARSKARQPWSRTGAGPRGKPDQTVEAREWQSTAKASPSQTEPTKQSPRFDHSSDFSTVNYGNAQFLFTRTQARVVKLLWEQMERGGHGLSQETIGDQIGSAAKKFEMRTLFRVKSPDGRYAPHPALGTMIKSDRKGLFRIVPPE